MIIQKISFRIFPVLSILILAGLACNLPTSDTPTGQPSPAVVHDQVSLDATQIQPDPTQPSTAPTQALLRPTRAEDQTSLPKPSIPVPPAQTTRQPQAGITPQQQSTPVASNETGFFYIVNDTSELVICYYYMTFSDNSDWGGDWLGAEDIIHPGESYSIPGMYYGTYDARALDCDENVLGEVYGFEFPPSDTFTLFDE